MEMRKAIVILLIFLLYDFSLPLKADTYFKADFSSGGLIGFLGALATYPINKAAGDFLIENYLVVSSFNVDVDNYESGLSVKYNSDNLSDSWFVYKFPAILNGLGTGIKWGYQKQYPSFIKTINVYGSLHATYNYFVLDIYDVNSRAAKYSNSILKISPGIGVNVAFGKFYKAMTFLVDFNLRYDVPIIYIGKLSDGPSGLKSGFSPRITISSAGPYFKKIGCQNIGLFCEWATYNQFKPSNYFNNPYKIKSFAFGVNLTCYPWK